MQRSKTSKATLLAALTSCTLLAWSGGRSGAWAASNEGDRIDDKQTAAVTAVVGEAKPVIQLAILLDTSGSMEGLINQARARIWDVVNDLGHARKNDQKPVLNIALYQYGSDKLPSSEGFLRCVQPFTTDLDLISDRLFSLQISGSAEYCGMVMDAAIKQLSWDQTPATAPLAQLPLRVMIVAGNEEFTQGQTDYIPVTKDAKQRGVFVNTVYCGAYAEGERTGWLNAAYLNGGSYNCIDHGAQIRELATPYDDPILKLNSELNETYVYYGSAGRENYARQERQDTLNVSASKSSGVSRAASKASYQYRNDHWDLVDYVESGKDIGTIPTADLPQELRPMTIEQRRAHIDGNKKRRDEIRRQIAELEKKRQEFIRDEHMKPANGETLDSAVIKAVREQATKVGFVFVKD